MSSREAYTGLRNGSEREENKKIRPFDGFARAAPPRGSLAAKNLDGRLKKRLSKENWLVLWAAERLGVDGIIFLPHGGWIGKMERRRWRE
jgi:hypothetical protein